MTEPIQVRIGEPLFDAEWERLGKLEEIHCDAEWRLVGLMVRGHRPILASPEGLEAEGGRLRVGSGPTGLAAVRLTRATEVHGPESELGHVVGVVCASPDVTAVLVRAPGLLGGDWELPVAEITAATDDALGVSFDRWEEEGEDGDEPEEPEEPPDQQQQRAVEERAVTRGLVLMERGLWDDAIKELETVQHAGDPEVADAAVNALAAAYTAIGRFSAAEALLRHSLDTHATDEVGRGYRLAALGVLARRQGRVEESEQLQAEALELLHGRDDALTSVVLRNVAYLYWELGRHERAAEIMDRLPEVDQAAMQTVERFVGPFLEPDLPEEAQG